jgi:phospholipid/cholesterol/gamma-HCH transport system substrate-binding protein
VATKKQKLKTGVFLAFCFGLSAVGLLVIAGYYENPGTVYWMEFDESILGLYEGGIVEYLGVKVGKVHEITVTPNRKAHVDILIQDDKVTLQEGVEAQLVMYSIAAGTMAISLRGGNPEGRELAPGSEIAVKPSTFEAISSQLEGLMGNVDSISNSLKEVLQGLSKDDIEEISEKVKTLLDDGRQLAGKLSGTLEKTEEQIERAIDEFAAISAKVKTVVDDVSALTRTAEAKVSELDVDATQQQMRRVLENIADLSEEVNAAMDQFDDISATALHKADNVQHGMNRALSEIGTTLETLNTFVNELREDPSALIRGKADIKE